MYQHKVQYYETDKMGIVHHSNYIRWMEEARVDFLEELGWGFDRLEAGGLVSPVVSVQAKYRHSCQFAQRVDIAVWVRQYTGVRMELVYEMRLAGTDTIVCTGISEHCFLDAAGRPVRLKKEWSELDGILREKAAAYAVQQGQAGKSDC